MEQNLIQEGSHCINQCHRRYTDNITSGKWKYPSMVDRCSLDSSACDKLINNNSEIKFDYITLF